MTVNLSNGFICRGTSPKIRGASRAAYVSVVGRLLNTPKVCEAVVLGRLAEFYGSEFEGEE